MSRLDELINELCPNGVEFKCLGDIGQVKMCKRILKSQTNTNGGIPFYKIGTFGGEANAFISEELFQEYREKYSYPKVGEILISAAGTIGRTVVYDGEPAYYQDSNIVWLAHDESNILNTFLRYCYELKPWNISSGGTIARLYNDNILKAKVPVPPLEVQREIVHILDSFTLLTAELTAELTARKKQYNFYRDTLIQKECKAEKVKLNTVCDIHDGTHQTPKYTNSGIPFVSVENIDDLYGTQKFISQEAYAKYKIKPRTGDVFMTRITAGIIGKCTVVDRDDDLAYYVSLALLRPNADILDSKYLKYYLESGWGRRELSKWILWDATPTKINKDDIGRVLISVPPLDTQKRLVQVIEHFDSICTDLNIGLPAEIEARQKQYEYYRDLLLTFAETGSTLMTDRQTELSAIKLIQYVFGCVMLPLGKVANVFRGEYITKKNTKAGTIPVILGGQEPAYYIDKYNHDGEIVVVARSGASAGFVSYWNQKIFVTDGFGYEEKSELITTKFLYYVLKNMESELNAMKRGAGVPHVSGKMLNDIKLPIPSLQEQQRIVDILDRFDTLCNDLSAGLPAEIEARQKQYEYYRDKLLSFKELPK